MPATPHPDNLYVGAGNVFFDRFVDGVASGAYRHLGNVESLTIGTTLEEITKKSSMDGDRGILKRITTGTEILFSMILNEFERHNLALALLGTVSSYTQAMDTVTDEDINNGDAVELDVWYPLGAVNPTISAVEQGATTLVLTDDYEFNAAAGLIRILSSGAGTAAATTWTGTRPELTGSQFYGGAESSIMGSLIYTSATNQATGPRLRVEVWRLSIRPTDVVQLISEEFGAATLQGTVEQDTTRAIGQRYYHVLQTDDLVDSSS